MRHDQLDDSLDSWLRQFTLVRLSAGAEQTRYQYRLNLQRFGEFLGHPPTLADLTDENVMACVKWLRESKGLSIATASKLRDNLKTLWEYVWRKGQVLCGPTMPPIHVPENSPIALNQRQLLQVWSLVSRLPGTICGIPESLWWTSKLGVMWSTGERIGPFMVAKWDEFDLDGGFWTVPAAHRKGRRRGMVHCLHAGAVSLLRQLQRFDKPEVWPRDFHWTILYRRLGEVMESAGLPNDRQHKFHIFRKSIATLVELFGTNSTEVMGWRDATMRETYVDRTIAPGDSVAKRIPWIGDMKAG